MVLIVIPSESQSGEMLSTGAPIGPIVHIVEPASTTWPGGCASATRHPGAKGSTVGFSLTAIRHVRRLRPRSRDRRPGCARAKEARSRLAVRVGTRHANALLPSSHGRATAHHELACTPCNATKTGEPAKRSGSRLGACSSRTSQASSRQRPTGIPCAWWRRQPLACPTDAMIARPAPPTSNRRTI
jgi:hypothetical protein